ncbi:GNAT family N-acetyltransferase [Arenibaculum pallidiluteum]|uniref:GNAT family N-acetyltransferase n=1 Tax=Arenibaculum pallidiluteum TaxID=2812559 RepID=UPI001A96B73A|nr:GNAT family N-acetyltransferase [Arenibaculum pallidiluteum]
MTGAGYQIRTMSRAELELAVDWAAAEGWNPGLHDAGPFHAADPEGFLVGVLDGSPVATISVVRYEPAFSFLGFYIVAPEARGRGLGLRLWQAGLERLAGRTIGLDGVVAQQENYRRSGFALAWRNIRFGGPAPAGGSLPAGLVDARTLPMDRLLAYDHALFQAGRPAFLAGWIALPGSVALARLRDGAVAGYGVVRPAREGMRIGPLFADDAGTARLLFEGLTAAAAGQPVFIDVPESNAEAMRLASEAGLTAWFETARMYAGPAPDLPAARIYGVTSFELG